MKNPLHLYEVFYSVAQYKSFSLAAKDLYISQPAVSKSIKTLEESLQIKLFTRLSKGVTLTPEGQLFYTYVKEALASLETGELHLSKLKSLEEGELHVGVSSTLGTHFLLPLLSHFTREYPHIKLHLVNNSTPKTLHLVKSGNLDLSIISSPFPSSDLNFIPLMPIQDIFICSPIYQQKLEQFLPQEIITQASFMLLSSESNTRAYIDGVLSKLGISLSASIVAGNMDFLIECAKCHLGITPVIESFVQESLQDGSLVKLTHFPTIPPREIGIAYSDNRPIPLAAEAFISFLQSIII